MQNLLSLHELVKARLHCRAMHEGSVPTATLILRLIVSNHAITRLLVVKALSYEHFAISEVFCDPMWFFHFGNFYPMVPAAENCLHHQLRNFTPHFKTQCSYHSSIIPIHCTTWFEMDRQAGISQLSEPSTRDGRKNTKKQR